ncbi:hypothetical protein EV182_007238, partial [Spiromyces aspiralis]
MSGIQEYTLLEVLQRIPKKHNDKVEELIKYVFSKSSLEELDSNIYSRLLGSDASCTALGLILYHEYDRLPKTTQTFIYKQLGITGQPSPQGAVAVEARASISPPRTPVKRSTGTGGSGRTNA